MSTKPMFPNQDHAAVVACAMACLAVGAPRAARASASLLQLRYPMTASPSCLTPSERRELGSCTLYPGCQATPRARATWLRYHVWIHTDFPAQRLHAHTLTIPVSHALG